ncbi:hypothetical protein O181_003425 [Austropuccinia psidii MF-1]|uniref:Uncharacterized protein n=1 Tax=Austropuccinia psidii MF-1 TaxID=1389203 RepID=A0A9Q3BEZ9_9BASI|nr:hypothetical protein [Austropuccinia psidii MF-1]
MSSKLTSIYNSDHSDPPPSVLYGSGVFNSFRELSEESMAPTEIYDINKTYDGFKSVRVIEPPCINCWKRGFPDNIRILCRSIKKGVTFGLEAPVDEPPTSDATSGHSNLTGSRIRGVKQWNNTSSSWANTRGPIHPQGNPIGVAPEVCILVTRKDERLGKLKRNLVVQDENDADAEGSDELDGEELETTTPIQKRRIQSPSIFPVQASTTNHELIRSPQPGHPHLPLPLPISNHLWPALLETQCLQNLNQYLTTVDAGISLETLLIRKGE